MHGRCMLKNANSSAAHDHELISHCWQICPVLQPQDTTTAMAGMKFTLRCIGLSCRNGQSIHHRCSHCCIATASTNPGMRLCIICAVSNSVGSCSSSDSKQSAAAGQQRDFQGDRVLQQCNRAGWAAADHRLWQQPVPLPGSLHANRQGSSGDAVRLYLDTFGVCIPAMRIMHAAMINEHFNASVATASCSLSMREIDDRLQDWITTRSKRISSSYGQQKLQATHVLCMAIQSCKG